MVKAPDIWPTPRLIRAARGLVGISQQTLAEAANIYQKTVANIEADKSNRMDPRRLKVLRELQRVLEDIHGIEFFAASDDSGEGVRFRKNKIRKSKSS
jgi:predicted transcriptional regulator